MKWLIALVVIAGLGGGGAWYWKQHDDKGPDYRTGEVTRGDLIQVVTATGQLNPQTNVNVGAQVSGIISKLYVDYNSPVTNKQVIAQIDPTTYKALVAQAEGDLASAKATLELQKAEEERSNALFQSKIISKSDEETAVATLHQAEATVMMKQASLDQAKANLSYATIYAPVDGIVISRSVDVGQTVASSLNTPTLFMIANDLKQMQIDALVSEADIGGIETNQAVNFGVDAYPTRTFFGKVAQIRNAPQTNQNVITYDTVISVNNSDLKLRPGMTASVSIITASRTNVLKIPNGALRFHPPEPADARKESSIAGSSNAPQRGAMQGEGSPGGRPGPGAGKQRSKGSTHTVYIVDRTPDGKETAKPVQIKTGINDGIYTQVLEGLKEGDQVIEGINIQADSARSSSSNPFGGGMRRF
jgi:HlyD family secretion protein